MQVKRYWVYQSLATLALENSLHVDNAVLIHFGEEEEVPKNKLLDINHKSLDLEQFLTLSYSTLNRSSRRQPFPLPH